MRRVTYKSVQDVVADAVGWEAANLSTDQQLLINRSINRRLAFGWDAFPWPEITPVERRRFALPWVVGTTYAAGVIRYDVADDSYWVSLQGTNTGHQPSLEDGWWGAAEAVYDAEEFDAAQLYHLNDRVYYPPQDKFYQCFNATSQGVLPDLAFWGELVVLERVIPYEQTGFTELGDIFRAYDANPRLSPGRTCEVPFRLQDNGVRVEGISETVWLQFRLRAPSWTGSNYAAATAYAAGAQVYYSGDYYKALQSTTGNLPTVTTHWERIDLPYVLSRYVAEASYADVDAKNQGQPDKLPSTLEEAYSFLSLEWDKIERQQSQSTQMQIAR